MAGVSIYQPFNYSSYAFVQGFLPVSFTDTLATFGLGSARSQTSDWVMEPTGSGLGSFVIDVTTIGAGGCFPVGLSAVTPSAGVNMVPVYVIGNTSGTTEGSTDPTAFVNPALIALTTTDGSIKIPDGYDSYAEVGFVLVDSSGDLVPYTMTGSGSQKYVSLDNAYNLLIGGIATSLTEILLTIGSASATPISSKNINKVSLMYTWTPNAAADSAVFIPFGAPTATLNPWRVKSNLAAVSVQGNFDMPIGDDDGQAAINYLVTSASDVLNLYIVGFDWQPSFMATNSL